MLTGMLARVGIREWSQDPLWASVYDWTVEHPITGRVVWGVGMGSDLGLLYEAASEISLQPRGARVLDVPCGGGVALRGLVPGQGVEYLACDISERMLERTRVSAMERRVEDQVSTVIGDAEALDQPDGAFDLVVAFTSLHCFGDPGAAVAELCRVTKPGGVLSGSTILDEPGFRGAALRWGGQRGKVLGPMCTGDELEAWLAEGGMRDVTLRRSGPMAYFRGVAT